MRYIQRIIKSLSAGKDKNQQGFTIVEVMIVLAIAGLILAVVFVAVPALQRNQRDNARRNDAAYIRTQLNQMVANNGNRIPSLVGAAGVTTNVSTAINGTLNRNELNQLGKHDSVVADATGTAGSTGAGFANNGKIILSRNGAFKDITKINWLKNGDNVDSIVIVLGKQCTGNIVGDRSPSAGYTLEITGGTVDFKNPGGSRNNIAVYYALEGDNNIYCDDTTL
ncbi:MAG: type II secretion system protein [Candidatus Saccharibacteria bacterium]|nr:type II secretion system protein [Candidatus Saccharibacteria bacterium]